MKQIITPTHPTPSLTTAKTLVWIRYVLITNGVCNGCNPSGHLSRSHVCLKSVSKVVSTHLCFNTPRLQPLPTGDFSRDSGFIIGEHPGDCRYRGVARNFLGVSGFQTLFLPLSPQKQAAKRLFVSNMTPKKNIRAIS